MSLEASRIELHTPRLLLRRFRAGDVDDALAYRNDPEFARFLPHIPQPFTRADAEAFVATNITEPWDTLPTFAVVRDGTLIGTVNFEIDPGARAAMLGYALARAHWGQGLALEAAAAAIRWLCTEHDLVEIWASTHVDNLRSRRVLEKLGMKLDHVDGAEVRYSSRFPCEQAARAASIALIEQEIARGLRN